MPQITLKGRSRRCKIFTAAGILSVIVVGSLLGWGIPRAMQKGEESNDAVAVILPLYTYPSEGAWTPFVDRYPSLPFYVIVNPNTGPGNNTLLDPNYARELPRLNSRKNVQAIGYVRTAWASRKISDVLQDVNIYSSWADNKTANYEVRGIFYDEAPNAYFPDTATFMNTIDRHVKNQTGFGGINFVIHNPGVIPNDDRLFTGADVIVVFENDFANYTQNSMDQKLSKLTDQRPNGYTRQNFAYMFHGLPANCSAGDFRGFLDSVRGGARMLFASDRSLQDKESIYEGFGADWGQFIDSLASLN